MTRIKIIDSFYVLDFDRCLGNISASFGLMTEIINELLGIDVQKIKTSYKEAEVNGVSFSVLDYIRTNYPAVDLSAVKNEYFNRAKLIQDDLLEPGAAEFINFLTSTGRQFCIMSYGEESWQNLKVLSTKLSDAPRLIVSSHVKGAYIASWLDKPSGNFNVPKECFVDNKPKIAREIILVDDKAGAFDGLPSGARGYLVQGSASHSHINDEINSFIKRVMRVDEIIEQEI